MIYFTQLCLFYIIIAILEHNRLTSEIANYQKAEEDMRDELVNLKRRMKEMSDQIDVFSDVDALRAKISEKQQVIEIYLSPWDFLKWQSSAIYYSQ